MSERIPFAEAISEPLLLKTRYEELSKPQQVILRAYYGLPLDDQQLYYWSMLQGGAIYDPLGFPVTVVPYPYIPQEYEQMWAILGRRSGKTDLITATIFAYESALGGHEEYVRPGQSAICYLVAHRMDVAQANMAFVRAALDSSPLLRKQIITDTATGIRLKNGISIMPAPASFKGQRGLAVPVCCLDEVGFFYVDAESANPDFEVERAIAYAQAQFPHRKRFGTSTPWTKEGILWKYHNAGTNGCKIDPKTEDLVQYQSILVCHAPTAAMENPRISRDFLERLAAQDADGFKRESLALFTDSISGFLSTPLVEKAVDKGIAERIPLPREGHNDDPIPFYVAAMDPAFRHDSFAFTICHSDLNIGIVQDVVRRWTPLPGQKLNPAVVLDEIAPLLKQYRINVVYSDQYQLESLQQLALDRHFYIEGVDFTSKSKAKIFGSLQQLVNQQRIRLLDPQLSPAARAVFDELVILEKHLSAQGAVQIAAPPGKHDDMATVIALAVFKAVWLLPQTLSKPTPEPNIYDLCQATIKKHREELEGNDAWD